VFESGRDPGVAVEGGNATRSDVFELLGQVAERRRDR